MRYALLLVFLVAACGEEAPKPQAKAPETAPKPAEPKPAAASQAPKAEAPKADPNRELAARVKRVLEDEAKIHAAGIDVTASNGVVTLWGTAATDDERSRAAQAAMKVEGVRSVDNQIKVVRGS